MDPFLFHFLRMLISLFLYVYVGSLLSLVYVFVSPTMSVIFILYSVVFIINVALPLFARSMMIKFFFSVCRATLSPLLILDLRSLDRLMVRTTSPQSSSATVSVMYLATTLVPAMISSTRRIVRVMAKYRSFIITNLPGAQVHYPPVCHFVLSLRFVVSFSKLYCFCDLVSSNVCFCTAASNCYASAISSLFKMAFTCCLSVVRDSFSLSIMYVHCHKLTPRSCNSAFFTMCCALTPVMFVFSFMLVGVILYRESSWHNSKVKEAIYISQTPARHLQPIIPPKPEPTHVTPVRAQDL